MRARVEQKRGWLALQRHAREERAVRRAQVPLLVQQRIGKHATSSKARFLCGWRVVLQQELCLRATEVRVSAKVASRGALAVAAVWRAWRRRLDITRGAKALLRRILRRTLVAA